MFEGDVVLGNSLTVGGAIAWKFWFEGDVVLGNSLTGVIISVWNLVFEGDVVLGNSLTSQTMAKSEHGLRVMLF